MITWESWEDRFFATVFFGSGVVYVAMLFTSAALAGGLLQALASKTESLTHSDAYALARTELSIHDHLCHKDGSGVYDDNLNDLKG